MLELLSKLHLTNHLKDYVLPNLLQLHVLITNDEQKELLVRQVVKIDQLEIELKIYRNFEKKELKHLIIYFLIDLNHVVLIQN